MTECRSPDFTSLARERQDDLNARAAFLTSRYGVKIQAISLSERDWMRISGEEKPWKPFAELLRKGQIAMHPFKWRMTFSMSLRAFFGI
ncbi:MAG: hypothetical protein EOP04_19620 [Proteobacteria bacterium]|nr:MAG: hypothetical protein EOP04_19620 [Pseudomonadota bacterium]